MAFTLGTFINCLEVGPFFNERSLEKLALLGQEGLAGPRLTYIERAEKPVRDLYLDLSLRLCETPQYFVYSDHLLYIGKHD